MCRAGLLSVSDPFPQFFLSCSDLRRLWKEPGEQKLRIRYWDGHFKTVLNGFYLFSLLSLVTLMLKSFSFLPLVENCRPEKWRYYQGSSHWRNRYLLTLVNSVPFFSIIFSVVQIQDFRIDSLDVKVFVKWLGKKRWPSTYRSLGLRLLVHKFSLMLNSTISGRCFSHLFIL